MIVWLTGLSGSGKTTIARELYDRLVDDGIVVEHLDGDLLRDKFNNRDFSKEGRDDHILKVGFIAQLLEKHGVVVLCTFISPYRDVRDKIREWSGSFIEVFVDCPVSECIVRDVKGLYKKAMSGEIKNFTGISDPYEKPHDPEIHLRTDQQQVNECADIIQEYIYKELGWI